MRSWDVILSTSEATACFMHRKTSVSVVWWADYRQVRWRQGGEGEPVRIFSGRDGGGVDQGGSSGNGEERLGLKHHVRSEEEGGLQGDFQVFGLSNWMVGDAVYWDED